MTVVHGKEPASSARSPHLRLIACALAVLLCLACGCQAAFAQDVAWPSFRADADNNAVTAAATPASTQQTALRWSRSFGSSWGTSPSPQIAVGNALFVMSGTTLYKVDQQTGTTLATGTMAAAPSFAYTAPTYGDGMIFVPLSGGIIQAFDAATLQSLWVYRDSLGGQNWVSPTYADGYVYGGFYTSDTGKAHFVCLNTKDPEASQAAERKKAVWTYTCPGGFYWTKAVAVGDAVVFGTNGGSSSGSGTGHVLSLDRTTGAVISKLDVAGDQHSAIVYHKGHVYFTSTGGYLYRVAVDAATGRLSDAVRVKIGVRSTSTPVIYGGRAYVGTNEGFASGSLAVVDLQDMDVCYTVPLSGPLQSSPVISTAYLQSTGRLYLYCTLNRSPGGMQLVTVPPGAQSASEADVQQIYDASGHGQYCICSPAVASDGTLFYKNDSGTVFTLGTATDADVSQVARLVGSIGTVSKDSKDAIAKARSAYDALTAAQRAQIPNYATLTKAERDYAALTSAGKGASGSEGAGASGSAGRQKESGASKGASGASRGSRSVAFPRTAGKEAAGDLSPAAMATGGAAGAPRLSTERTAASGGAQASRDAGASSPSGKTEGASDKSGSSSKAAKDAGRAATQTLPDAQSAPFPWWWLALAGAALAALIGLFAYRRHSRADAPEEH